MAVKPKPGHRRPVVRSRIAKRGIQAVSNTKIIKNPITPPQPRTVPYDSRGGVKPVSDKKSVREIPPPPPRKITNNNDRRFVQQRPAPVRVVNKQRSGVKSGRRGDVARSQLRVDHDQLLSKYRDKIASIRNSGAGRVLIICACGPSISEVDIARMAHQRVDFMSVNKPDNRIYPPKYWIFCDMSQHKRNKELFDKFNGVVINSSSIKARHPNQILLRNRAGRGFSRDLMSGFHIGRSTTYAAMQVALWMNYDRIYILGLDMAAVNIDGKKVLHFYGKNPDVSDDNREKRFSIEAQSYEYAAANLPEIDRKKFFIASAHNPWGFAKKFNLIDHNNAVEHLHNYLGIQA